MRALRRHTVGGTIQDEPDRLAVRPMHASRWTLWNESGHDFISVEGILNRVPLSPMKRPSWQSIVVFRSLEIFINLNQFGSVESGCETIGLDDSLHNLRHMRALFNREA